MNFAEDNSPNRSLEEEKSHDLTSTPSQILIESISQPKIIKHNGGMINKESSNRAKRQLSVETNGVKQKNSTKDVENNYLLMPSPVNDIFTPYIKHSKSAQEAV